MLLLVGLTLKPTKAQIGRAQVKYFGYDISREGIEIGNDRIQGTAYFPQPSIIEELRSV